MFEIPSYPKTLPISSSGANKRQGESWDVLKGRYLVIEEKVDGIMLGIAFNQGKTISLFHRNSSVLEDVRFISARRWFEALAFDLFSVLNTRYVLYGEWLEYKHTIFYNCLPHFFLEYDIYDQERRVFLATKERQALLYNLPLTSVKVLAQGAFHQSEVRSYLLPSVYKSTKWQDTLKTAAKEANIPFGQIAKETLLSDIGEGLYIKVEEEGIVQDRYKLINPEFLEKIASSQSHWQSRQLLRNRLKA